MEKVRINGKLKKFDEPKTPFERFPNSNKITAE